MARLRRLLVLAAGIATLVGCSQTVGPPATNAAVDKSAIDAVEAAFYKNFNAGDGAAIAAMYAEDAILNVPGLPALKGRAAIGQYFVKDAQEAHSAGITESDGPSTEVGVSGDLAWRWGTYSTRDKSGAPVEAGKYITVFQRTGGKWMIFRDTWNSDSPPAAAAAPAASN